MPRPERKQVTITVDGREIETTEGTMLLDAAKAGDVEIPYFCYEPKLGQPVGACRMCLVEIEGIPKLQTSCSTPVRDGMVVHTTTDRVQAAQNSVVEFLLVNHPLDCPVCDKGGECPLQDITFGWGKGFSRMVEPKRHFQKPLALSPLVAIDRERCILCYRCVRFSQEVSEDWQLIFTERGAHTFVGTHDGHPYSAPFSGNIIELCPVGALTSRPYRFRARPWDIEGSGGICTLCPSQCNVEFTVRDDKVARVLARQHDGVDDGWLCDKGRFAYQAIHADERITAPLLRDAKGQLKPASWEDALAKAAELAGHKGKAAALVGGQASNEEAFLLQRLFREALDSGAVASRTVSFPRQLTLALADPARQAGVEDIDYADNVVLVGCEPLDDASILDLRIRKAVRRNHVKLHVATERPSTLDPNAVTVQRSHDISGLDLQGETLIIWHERIGPDAAAALLDVQGAKLLEIPAGSNGRGIREAGALTNSGPGYSEVAPAEVHAPSAYYLFQTDPLRDTAERAQWQQALGDAELVVAHASVLTEGIAEHADVVFPAESHAEKEGTIVHPDGRVQRLRAAIGHPGQVRAGWQVLSDLAKRIGLDLKVLTSGMAFRQLVEAVPFYAGLTLEQIGGRGIRWPETEAAANFPELSGAPASEPAEASNGQASASQNGHLRVISYRSIWDAPEVEISPALHFTRVEPTVELAPEDAAKRGIADSTQVQIGQLAERAAARIRTGVASGTVVVNTNLLNEEFVEVTPQ
jgi:NADH-quinone oxidoreductase subunit G